MVVPVELKQRYLSRRIQDLARLKEALLNNDFSPALKLGHQVKGNADTFEFPHMATIGVELEHAAKREDKETLMNLVKKMESAISSAQSFFS
jgi:HPt (histidine-containing phosphotransfer) domain-containing protein